MPDFAVAKPAVLGPFLLDRGVQPWRVPVLVQCGGITATRLGEPLDLRVDGPGTALRANDVVRVQDRLSASCVSALGMVASKEGQDYAMLGPPSRRDDHIPRLGRLLRARPGTVLLGAASLEEFVQQLGDSAAVTHPVRDLVLACHASPRGVLVVPLKRGGDRFTLFEDLEDAIKAGTIVIPTALVAPRPPRPGGFPQPVRFLIKGCGIGWAVPFLRRLKEALGLGGLATVVAPRFFHAAGEFRSPAGAGLYEFLAYEFPAFVPGTKPLRTRHQLVSAFRLRGYTDYEGKPITEKQWQEWIPDPPVAQEKPLWFGSSFAGRPLKATSFFSVGPQDPVELGVPAEKDPGSDEKRKEALGDYLATLPVFQSTHDFPIYERVFCKDLKEMLDAHQWRYSFDGEKKMLKCTALRMVHVVHQPITDKKTGELIHNFFPTRPAGQAQRMFADDDRRFFVSV
jgi:hypothetical protein